MANENNENPTLVEAIPATPSEQLTGAIEEPAELLPSTKESQKQTEVTSEFQNKVKNKQKLIKRNSGVQPSFTEAQHLVIEDLKTEQEQKKTKEAEQLAEELKAKETSQQNIDAALQKYEEGKQAAIDLGIGDSFTIDPDMEDLIAQNEQKRNAQIEIAQQETLKAAEEEKKKQAIIQQAEVEQEKKILRKQDNQIQAQEQFAKEKVVQQMDDQIKIEQHIKEEDKNIPINNFADYWNTRSTGGKIMTGISLFLGLFAGKQPSGMRIIQKAIDDDIKSRQDAGKAAKEDYWKQKDHALKVVDAQIKRMRANTSNNEYKLKLEKFRFEINKEARQIYEQRRLQKQLTSPHGLTREQVFTLDQKTRDTMVLLSDGNFRPAMSAQLAKKLNQETIPEAKDAIRGLERLKEILDEPAAEANLILRAESKSIKTAIKGALRLQLFGPGVMTDFESKMADEIIGDPTKIIAWDPAEKAKLNALLKKVKQGTIDKIRQAGVAIPKTKNEKMLDQFMKKNPKTKRSEAMTALIKLGFWDESADIGF